MATRVADTCQGACEEHRGILRHVTVADDRLFDWGHFVYCEEAIAKDRKNGLIVTEVLDGD